MAITNTWGIVQLDAYPEKDGLTDVVFTVHWNLTGDDGEGHTGYAYGSVGVTLDPETPYTPFAQLTQDEVLGWVWETVNKDETEASVTAQVKNLANPPVVQPPLPWAK